MIKTFCFCVVFFTGAVLKAHPPEPNIYSDVFELRGQRLTLLSHMSRFFEGELGDVPLKNEQDALNSLSGLLDVQLREEEEAAQELKAFMPKVLALYEHNLSPQMQGLWRTQIDYVCREKKIEALGCSFYETLLFSWEFVDFQGVKAPQYVKDLSYIVRQFGNSSALKIAFVCAILPHVQMEEQNESAFLQNKPSVESIREKMAFFLGVEHSAVLKGIYQSAWGQSCVQGYLDVWARAQTVGDIDAFVMNGMTDKGGF